MSGKARIVAGIVVALGLVTALPAVAQNQNPPDLQVRVQRLERDIRDLEAATFRRQPGQGPADAGPEPPPDEGMVDLGPMLRRLDELDASLGRLTGQMEEIGHRVDQLSDQADRLQKEIDLQAMEGAPPPPQASLPPPSFDAPPQGLPRRPDRPDNFASAGPDSGSPTLKPYSQGVLGTLPGGPQKAGDPKKEYDTAMVLLSRAQYDPARTAFRNFVDSYPDDDRAPAALYWTADIAYSAKKDYDNAARDFAELIKKYPDSARAPEGMLKLALSLFQLGQMKEGCAALSALPAKYPNAAAPVAAQAKNARRDNKCR